MRLSISATSFAAAVAASQALLRLGSNSAVASAVDVAYEKHDERLQAAGEHPSLDEECDFVTSFKLRGSDADAGILGCTNPEYVCVEDDSSSRGGRCVPDVFAHRKLQTSNTPPCTTKCTGIGACGGGTDPNIVGAASCCGYRACFGITGTSSIDAGSCLGNKACYKMKNAVIGAKSCRGDSKYKGEDGAYGYACAYLQGTVGYNSCIEYGACYQKSTMNKIFHIGDNSCYGASTCSYAANTDGTIKIGDESCNGYYACYDALGSIGSGSCNAKNACYKTYQYIGNNLCNTENECFENKVVLTSEPSKAPTKFPTKAPVTAPPTSSPTEFPTKAPVTAPPTKTPTKVPTKAPVTAPPTKTPTKVPTKAPVTNAPTAPTKSPTQAPTKAPITAAPVTMIPTALPTNVASKTSKEAKDGKTDKGGKKF